ncbi:thiolase family protein [Parasphingopyxis sp.]|uniref:thiolase family protein n=1 Tax=Parasphingopyxis sp. TaxID=1920299 RepID=UPI00260D42A1|nr:thiolase family protein [Parasphingopyxis sp.]
MTNVAVIGVGMTRFTRQSERGYDGMAREAVTKALDDAGLETGAIEAIFCGETIAGIGAGQRMLKDFAFGGVPVTNIENACASSSSAMIEACAWIKAGLCDVALALGAEVLSPAPKGPLEVSKENWMFAAGMNLPMWYAMQAHRHMHEYGLTREQLAQVVVKSRTVAQHNEVAHFREPTSVEEVLGSALIADPLTLFQCCPKTDGASAVILASERVVRKGDHRPVWIRGAKLQSGTAVYSDHPIEIGTARRSAQMALEEAGVEPTDLDVAEVHDAFSIGEILYTEALGICGEGEAGHYVEAGHSLPSTDRTAINTSGGLLSRGHPLAASGLAMINEIVLQLRGEAGARQKEGARLGAAHNMGASDFQIDGNVCSVFVLEAG